MTRHEQLTENYEDALFALLMEQIAEEEGEKLLFKNECLNHNPKAAVPELVDAHCRRTIKQVFSKNQRRDVAKAAFRVLNKVAVFALIVAVLFTTAYAAFPEFRIRTLNLLIEVSDVATSLTFINDTGSTIIPNNEALDSKAEQFIFGYRLPEIPEGFLVIDEGSTSQSAWIEYSDGDEATIFIHICKGANSTYNIDTENAQAIENIQIHGYDGLLVEKDNRVQVIWGDTEQEAFIDTICTGLDKSVVLSIANQITFVADGRK